MEKSIVQQYIGKKCLIILKNHYSYTATIPDFDTSTFEIIDRFGENIAIDCEFILFLREVKE